MYFFIIDNEWSEFFILYTPQSYVNISLCIKQVDSIKTQRFCLPKKQIKKRTQLEKKPDSKIHYLMIINIWKVHRAILQKQAEEHFRKDPMFPIIEGPTNGRTWSLLTRTRVYCKAWSLDYFHMDTSPPLNISRFIYIPYPYKMLLLALHPTPHVHHNHKTWNLHRWFHHLRSPSHVMDHLRSSSF